MRKTLLFGAAALFGIIATDPAFCMQNGTPATDQTQAEQPVRPDGAPLPPVSDPSQPAPPITEPLPPEMPPVAGEARDVSRPPSAPMIVRTDAPAGPLATLPSSGDDQAMSGGTTSEMKIPQPATKAYPLCTRTIQDNCRNPGEGPKAAKRPRG